MSGSTTAPNTTTFSYTGQFVTYTVPATGFYDILAFGAQGGMGGGSLVVGPSNAPLVIAVAAAADTGFLAPVPEPASLALKADRVLVRSLRDVCRGSAGGAHRSRASFGLVQSSDGDGPR